MTGLALGDIDLHFAWQAWHLWHWAGSGGALGSQFAVSIVYVHAVFGSSAANAFASMKDVEMIDAVVHPFLPMCCSCAFRPRQGQFH